MMRVNVPGKGQREFSTGETDYADALKVLQKKEAEIADGENPTKAQEPLYARRRRPRSSKRLRAERAHDVGDDAPED